MNAEEEDSGELEQLSAVIKQMSVNDHEQVVFCYDKETGLKAIIAIHNTTLGPALGGTRMWKYNNEAEALNDALRLSRGMTYKSAISGLDLGGGKAVIIGDSLTDKSEALFRRFGKFVESLNGKYVTAEDVGIDPKDIESILMETKHVVGLSAALGGSGNPALVTAYGVYMGMKASVKEYYGSDSLKGKRVIVQGVGHVGECLIKHLIEEGAEVAVSDINANRIAKISEKYEVEVVESDAVYDYEADIYAPCALGATLNDNTIPRLKCKVVAGSANNQLEDEVKHGEMLQERGILCAPDFLINAGGLINVYQEVKGISKEKAMELASNIYHTTLDIFAQAKTDKITPIEAAMVIAQKRIDEAAKLKSRI